MVPDGQGSVSEAALKKSCDKAVKLNQCLCAAASWKPKASSQVSQIQAKCRLSPQVIHLASVELLGTFF